MAYLALALLFLPSIILADPLHIPLSRRHQQSRDYNAIAERMRTKYSRSLNSYQHRSNRRATVNGISIFDQVNQLSLLPSFYINSLQE